MHDGMAMEMKVNMENDDGRSRSAHAQTVEGGVENGVWVGRYTMASTFPTSGMQRRHQCA